MPDLQQQIDEIKERNSRVEADKAWETSMVRRGFICVVTYVFAVMWLNLIHANNPFLNAFVPTVGYFLSTVSLPYIKNYWTKRIRK